MERLNLDEYNSDDYDEYLSDNMEDTPIAIAEVKTTIKQDPPLAPPAMTVIFQLKTSLWRRISKRAALCSIKKGHLGASVSPIIDKNSRAITMTTPTVTSTT